MRGLARGVAIVGVALLLLVFLSTIASYGELLLTGGCDPNVKATDGHSYSQCMQRASDQAEGWLTAPLER